MAVRFAVMINSAVPLQTASVLHLKRWTAKLVENFKGFQSPIRSVLFTTFLNLRKEILQSQDRLRCSPHVHCSVKMRKFPSNSFRNRRTKRNRREIWKPSTLFKVILATCKSWTGTRKKCYEHTKWVCVMQLSRRKAIKKCFKNLKQLFLNLFWVYVLPKSYLCIIYGINELIIATRMTTVFCWMQVLKIFNFTADLFKCN